MEESYNIPNVYIQDLERLTQKIRGVVGAENAEVSFEFIIASLFPTSWENIQNALKHQYTKGYIQGRLDKENEIKNCSPSTTDDDVDCFCD